MNKESEYHLKEEKNFIPVGKKMEVKFVYSLDLKEDTASHDSEDAREVVREKERKNNVFVMNMIDFNLFKLRSAIFLIQFPVTYTLLIMNVWKKLLPEHVSSA